MEYQKDEEDSFKTAVKMHSVLSSVVRWITEAYPEKFGQNIRASINDKTVTITGDLEIFENESYHKDIEYNEQKENYKVILKKN